jgi:DNA-binding MarR family transcriptional regulator
VDAGQLHKVARLLREVALDATADPGETPVSAGDVAIAEDIAHHEKASVGEIAARTGLAQSLVSRTVAKLHDARVVVTERDPDDGRRVLISIAPGVRTGLFRSRARRPVEPTMHSRYPDFSEAEIAHVVALLNELADILIIEPASDGASASAPNRRPRQSQAARRADWTANLELARNGVRGQGFAAPQAPAGATCHGGPRAASPHPRGPARRRPP